jgi:hypothetical protein
MNADRRTAITRIPPCGRTAPRPSGRDSLVDCLGTLGSGFPRQLIEDTGPVGNGAVDADERSACVSEVVLRVYPR